MKIFIIVLTLMSLSLEMSIAATVPACDYPSEQNYIKDPFWGQNEYLTEPRGNCDFMGKMDSGQVKLCSEVAEKKGYTCFQVGTYLKIDPFWGMNRTTKLCYACF